MGGASPGGPFPAATDHGKGAQEDDTMPDWDDEDLLAMQAEPMVRHWLLKIDLPCKLSQWCGIGC